MKVADVKLGWSKSTSADVSSVSVTVINDGVETTSEFGPEVEEMMVVVSASTSVQFSVTTFDGEGLESTSTVYTFTLGDLEAPGAATALYHTVVAVRDVE